MMKRVQILYIIYWNFFLILVILNIIIKKSRPITSIMIYFDANVAYIRKQTIFLNEVGIHKKIS